jgi:hypothetical protein
MNPQVSEAQCSSCLTHRVRCHFAGAPETQESKLLPFHDSVLMDPRMLEEREERERQRQREEGARERERKL